MQAVEILGDREKSFPQSQLAWQSLVGRQRDQTGDGFSGPGDDDFLTGGGLVDEAGQMGLGFMDVDGCMAYPRYG